MSIDLLEKVKIWCKLKAEKCDIVYSIFPIINTSFFPNFFPSFHLHHAYQTIDDNPLIFIIYFFNNFLEV